MAIGVQQFSTSQPDEMSPYGNLLQNSLQKFGALTNAAFLPKEKQAALQQAISEAIMKQAQAKFSPQMEEAKLGHEQAQAPYLQAETNKINTMTPLEANKTQIESMKQQILNKYLPQREQAEIGETTQRGNYYAQGGARSGLGTGDKSELFFQNLVGRDNPQFKGDPDKIYEAANVLRMGGDTLKDGTRINPLSPASENAYNRLIKAGSTAALVTGGVKANAAEREMPVFDKYIQEGRSGYGDTTLGLSIQQAKDTLNPNAPGAAERMGKYIASDMLAFDKAALQTRIAGTESGVTIIDEVMKKAKQTIDAKYFRISDKARQIALDTMGKALREALAARNKYGIGAAGATGSQSGFSGGQSRKPNYNNLPEGKIEETRTLDGHEIVKINGKWIHAD